MEIKMKMGGGVFWKVGVEIVPKIIREQVLVGRGMKRLK